MDMTEHTPCLENAFCPEEQHPQQAPAVDLHALGLAPAIDGAAEFEGPLPEDEPPVHLPGLGVKGLSQPAPMTVDDNEYPTNQTELAVPVPVPVPAAAAAAAPVPAADVAVEGAAPGSDEQRNTEDDTFPRAPVAFKRAPVPVALGVSDRYSAELARATPAKAGAFGLVYSLIKNAPRRKLAAKKVPRRDDERHRPNCINEIAVSLHLKERGVKNITHVEEFWEDKDGNVYILAEWVTSSTAEELLNREANRAGLKEDVCCKVMRSLLEVLADLWRHGVMHRDVKLDNFFIDGTKVILTDMGNAVIFDEAGLPDVEYVAMSKSTNPFFQPPFVNSGKVAAADLARVDLYGAARCCLALLCGLDAFNAMSRTTAPDLSAHAAISPEAKHFLAAALGGGLRSAAEALRHPWITGQPFPMPRTAGCNPAGEHEPALVVPMDMD